MAQMNFLWRLLPAVFLCTAACSGDSDSNDLPGPTPDAGIEVPDATTSFMDAASVEDAGEPDMGFDIDTGPRDTGVIDPNETPFVTTRNEGDPDTKIDIVIIGDGYRIEQLDGLYENHFNRLASQMFQRRGGNRDVTQPFRYYQEAFNIHRIYVASAESGIDDPANGTLVDTALDGSLECVDPVNGPCHVDFAKVDAAIESALQGSGITPDWRVVVLNTTEELGAAVVTPNGPLAIYGGGLGSGDFTFRTREVALQQLAIAFCGAGDERGGRNEDYQGPEPDAVNLTRTSTSLKWSRWNGFNVGQDGIGEVGIFEGGGGFERGIFRPTQVSKFTNPQPATTSLGFNAVVREAIILQIYRTVPLVFDFPPTDQVLDDPNVIDILVQSGELVNRDDTPGVADPIVIEWRLNGMLQPVIDTRFGFRQLAESLNLPGGMHTVSVRVRDTTSWVRDPNRPNMETVLTWNVIYRPQ